MSVDCRGEVAKFLIKFVFKVLHWLGKVFFGDERIGVGGSIYCLNFIGNRFLNECVSKPDGRVVEVHAIYTPTVGNKIYPPSKHVCRFMKPFCVSHGV